MSEKQSPDFRATDKRRWFVLTMGRSGSSLLCAVLADAGAGFGQQAPEDWDPRRGAMEHPQMLAAAHQLRRSRDITHAADYLFSPRLESAWRWHRARALLRRALPQAQYFKAADLDFAIQPCFALGYEPRLILSFRDPADSLHSLLVGRKRTTPDDLIADYLRVYRQGIALMQTFGGCVVSFDDLQGFDHEATFQALAKCTDLNVDALLDARTARAKPMEESADSALHYPQAQALYEVLKDLRGSYFEPSRTTTRKLQALATPSEKS